jgi:hypothetical protein
MHKILLTTLLFSVWTASASLSQADEPRLLHQALYGDSEGSFIDLRGWASAGFTFNTDSPKGNFNGPLSFNDRANELQMNQLYMVAEHAIDPKLDEYQLGGRADFVYGTDAAFTQAVGLDTQWSGDRFYKTALPQFYLEGYAPVLDGVRLKVGHFYTPIGYEVVTAPDNFFYSHAFTMQYGEPFTHTGALLSVAPNSSVTLTGGVVRGWDNFKDESDKNLSFIAGVTLALDESTSLIVTAISGNEGASQNRTGYSAILTHQFEDDWSYVVQHDYASQERGGADGQAAQWYGVNQYLVKKLCDSLSVGGRVEWFRDDDATRVAGLRSGSAANESDFFGFSFGANYSPTSYIKFRPEIRWDLQASKKDGSSPTFDNGSSMNQLTIASDLIFSF